MATTTDVVKGDPIVSTHFQVDVGGVTGFFMTIDGLGSETETTDHKIMAAQGKESITRKIPGRLTWGDITLKRGLTSNMDFYNWAKLALDGKLSEARANGSIIMYDEALTQIAVWEFNNAWCSKISGPSFSSESNEVAVEEFTIVHEGIRRTS